MMQFYKILPSGSYAPCVLYGLPKVVKVHKTIVSSVNTYNYNLASFLVVYLSQSRPTNTLSKTVLVSRIGPKSTRMTMEVME